MPEMDYYCRGGCVTVYVRTELDPVTDRLTEAHQCMYCGWISLKPLPPAKGVTRAAEHAADDQQHP